MVGYGMVLTANITSHNIGGVVWSGWVRYGAVRFGMGPMAKFSERPTHGIDFGKIIGSKKVRERNKA